MGDTGYAEGSRPTSISSCTRCRCSSSAPTARSIPPPTSRRWHRIANLAFPVGDRVGAQGARNDRGAPSGRRADREHRHLVSRRARPRLAAARPPPGWRMARFSVRSGRSSSRGVVALAVRRERSLMKRRVSAPVTRVEEDPERDPRDQEFRAAARRAFPVLLALDPLARMAEVLDRLAHLVTDVVVGRDPARERDRGAPCRSRAPRTTRAPSRRRASARPRSFSSVIARSMYGLMASAASSSVSLVFGMGWRSFRTRFGRLSAQRAGRSALGRRRPHPCRLRGVCGEQRVRRQGGRIQLRRPCRLDDRPFGGRHNGREREGRPARGGSLHAREDLPAGPLRRGRPRARRRRGRARQAARAGS